jgi:hypothetical protein
MRSVYRILVGKLELKRPLREARHGWEEYIKLDLKRNRGRGRLYSCGS